ncbi:hypothetical protein AAC03nite_17090 [Alicyclobacillus acidoterrestris]|nr:hypothetical protein AAC03nite_17090 [Alicyclobacillus acidoterrestris]
MTSNILLLGDGKTANDLATWLQSKGDYVTQYRVNHPVDLNTYPRFDVVLDVHFDVNRKMTAWASVRNCVPADAMVFTSCTAACVTQVAALMDRNLLVAGFHPWAIETLDVMELACPLQEENDDRWGRLVQFFAQRGKHVEVVDDAPGLVFPRILSLLVNEASFALSEGVATARDIDSAMVLGTNYPKGPFTWADEIGVDEILAVLASLHSELGEDRYRPSLYLKKLVYAGRTGKSAGRGFYEYQQERVVKTVVRGDNSLTTGDDGM